MVKNYATGEGYQYKNGYVYAHPTSESKYCVKFKLGDKSIVSEEIQFSMTGDAIAVKLGDYLKNKYDKVIVFHHNDLDGRGAAHLLHEVGADHFVEINYSDHNILNPIEKTILGLDESELVVIVDYSMNADTFREVADTCKNLIWLDHHRTSFEVVDVIYSEFMDRVKDGSLMVNLNNSKCGTAITYEQIQNIIYTPVENTQRFVSLVNDYDLWILRFKESLWLNNYVYASANYAPGSEIYKNLIWDEDGDFDKALMVGKKLTDLAKEKNEVLYDAFSFEVKKDNLKGIAIVGYGNSQLFGDHVNDYDFVMVTHKKGSVWETSLYTTKNNVDVSTICKALGGGGHKKAAGFKSEECPYGYEDAIFTRI